jgi:nucleotide-binding universal stress UspA family protein
MNETSQGMTKTSSGYRRILWPTDFSELAMGALPHAMVLAADAGAELVVLHVLIPPPPYSMPEIAGDLWAELRVKQRAAAEEELRRLAEQVKGPKIQTRTVLAEGVPFDQILRTAERLQCDLIVMATHGHTGLAHAVIGSVAENVVRRAPCPVLTVRPPGFHG